MSDRRINDLFLNHNQRIVVVDDDKVIVDFLKITLENSFKECEVVCFTEINDEFYDYISKNKVDLFIMDIRLEHLDGIDLTKKIIEKGYGSVFLFISGFDYSPDDFKDLIGKCVFDFMSKPLHLERFISSVVSLLNISTTYNLLQTSDIQPVRNFYNNLIEQDRLMIKMFKEEVFKDRVEVSNLFCKT